MGSGGGHSMGAGGDRVNMEWLWFLELQESLYLVFGPIMAVWFVLVLAGAVIVGILSAFLEFARVGNTKF